MNLNTEWYTEIDLDKFKDRLVGLALSFLSDPAFQIRKEATDTLSKLGEIFGRQWL